MDGSADDAVIAEIDTARQVDAIVERLADTTRAEHDVATELFDLLLTLAKQTPDDDCKTYLIERMADWIARNRAVRVPNHHAA